MTVTFTVNEADDLSKYIRWVANTHVKRYREHYHTRGQGHVYQGRFKSFAVQDDSHLLAVLRYVEGNAIRARLTDRAELWPWGSLSEVPLSGDEPFLTRWPIERPANWIEVVNAIAPAEELAEIRSSVKRDRPFGSRAWVAATAARLGVSHTLHSRGRPSKNGHKNEQSQIKA